MNTEDIKYQNAKKRVKQLKAFYLHLISFVMINLFLFLLNYLTSPWSLWFYWVTLFWGIALVLHWLTIIVFGNRLGKDWEERKIQEILDKG